jgi:hypothetical protein
MKLILEYNDFVSSNERYFGIFMTKKIFATDTYFKWNNKRYDYTFTKDTKLIDVIKSLISKEQLIIDNYRDFITYTLGDLYYDDIISYNSKLTNVIKLQDFDDQKGEISILNNLLTNKLVMKYLLNLYSESSINSSSIFRKIWKDRKELFIKGGKYFDRVFEILTATFNKGKKTEANAVNDLIEFFKKLLNDDTITIQTPESIEDDMLKGFDLLLVSKHNYTKTIQIKPLNYKKYRFATIEDFNKRVKEIKNNDNTDKLNLEILENINKLNVEKIKVFELSTKSVSKHYFTDFIIFKEENLKSYYVCNNKDIIHDIKNENYILPNVSVKREKYNDVEIVLISTSL